MIRAMRTAAWTTAVAAGLLLAGCGGSATNLAGGGTSGTGITQGPVTSFGSVVVNGTRYETSIGPDGTVFVGPTGDFSEDDLAVGMLVQVEWEKSDDADDRQATRIAHLPELIGPVTGGFTVTQGGDGSTTASIQVAGRTVVVDSATVMDDPFGRGTPDEVMSPGGLTVEQDIVQVSGFLATDATTSESRVRAARIARVDRSPTDDPQEVVTGVVNAAGNSTFQILDVSAEPITVTFADGVVQDDSLFANAGAQQLRDGEAVRVVGQLNTSEGTLAVNTPDASIDRPLEALQLVSQDPDDPPPEAEIRGVVSQAPETGGNTFVANAQVVEFEDTDLVSPATRESLRPGVRVEVRGVLVQSGGQVVLRAERITLEQLAEVELEDEVTQVITDGAGAVTGFETRVGLDVLIRPDTILKDDTDQAGPNGNLVLSTLAATDFVEVRGFFDAGGNLVAKVLEREDDTDEGCKLEARVASFDANIYRFVGREGLAVQVPAGAPVVPDDSIGEFETEAPENCGLTNFQQPPADVNAGLVVVDLDGVERSDDGGGIIPGNGDDDPVQAFDDLPGTVEAEPGAASFQFRRSDNGIVETIGVVGSTFIDDSIIVAAGGMASEDTRLSELILTLPQLLDAGDVVAVTGQRLGDGTIEATQIESNDDDDGP